MNSVVEAYFRQDQLQITVFYYKYYTYKNYHLMFMNVFNGKNILFTDKNKEIFERPLKTKMILLNCM